MIVRGICIVCLVFGVVCAEAIEICDEDAAYSQPPAPTTTLPGYSDASDNMLRAYDNFSGLTEPVVGLVWWGGGINMAPCTRATDNFEVGFYNDNGAQPGSLVASETFSPVAVATGTDVGFGELLRYEVTFAEPVDLAAGWVSVFGVGDLSGCFFYWANGVGGDNLAYSSGVGGIATDFAFCLLTSLPGDPCVNAHHVADQNTNGVIELTELLRVIQFYNSGGLHCADDPGETEDGYVTGSGVNQACCPHDSDYAPSGPDWQIGLTELLRLVQFFNSDGYHSCPDEGTEDRFCPGFAK
ncbi:MAG TPA: hypothetical protein PKI11_16050 [Candidatus Hydrogenedentes bacterium]|nr:hypothetical protein [Candidatus Hydrogenedentota bacterium]HNT87888.1 hypothetical protein [Candidatus Hydrogenedentota bacterium]